MQESNRIGAIRLWGGLDVVLQRLTRWPLWFIVD